MRSSFIAKLLTLFGALTLITMVQGKEVRRAYSLCSSPFVDDHLAVSVKRVDNGLMSNWLPDNLKAGATMKVMEPMGQFTTEYSKEKKRHLILFAGGSGITPMMSIIKSLLTQEPDIDHLSKQEADESTGRTLSYYEHDLVVVDWDAALVIDQPQNFDETLYILELANLQLAELEAYDRLLDDSLDEVSRTLHTSFERVERVLAVLRRVGDAGLGATSIRECLLLQLDDVERRGHTDPVARTLVTDHLEDLAHLSNARLASIVGRPAEHVAEAREFIRRHLHPPVGSDFGSGNNPSRTTHAPWGHRPAPGLT